MKRVKYYIGILLLGMSVSCSELELSPIDNYASGNFWKNEEQVKGAVRGLYRSFRANYNKYWVLGELRGGLLKAGTSSVGTSMSYQNTILQNMRPDNMDGEFRKWAGFYTDILEINLLIENVSQADYISEANKKIYLAQAHGLRAWYYFWLYRTYGGVPIVKETRIVGKPINPATLSTPRASAKETLDFVKSDINKSLEYFENSSDRTKSKWTRFASLMLKTEIYLWSAKVTTENQIPVQEDLKIAKEALAQVTGYTLLPNFRDVFSYKNKENAEIIFTIPFLDTEASNSFSNFVYSSKGTTFNAYNAQGERYSSDPLEVATTGTILRNEYKFALFEKYEEEDTRRSATFLDFYTDANRSNGGLALSKFMGLINSANTRVFADDIPIYRQADVLLLMAEIVNKEGGDPSQYINQIRSRAYGSAYNQEKHGYVNSSFEANELAILLERDKEFVAENKRWFDIRRMQDASGKPLVFSSVVNYGSTVPVLNEADNHKLLMPIDENTMNNDKALIQNPWKDNK